MMKHNGNEVHHYKTLPPGLHYVQFRHQYQNLLGNYYPGKEFFHRTYGGYCLQHKKKEYNAK